MLTILLHALAIILAIGIIIGIHEWGHFLFAKLSGVKVLRFSIGFGKPLWQKTVKGTEYVIARLPIGGYVRLLDEREGKVRADEVHLAFNRQSCWKRFGIIFAGPLFNLLFAWFAFWLVLTVGIHFVVPKVGTVVPHSIAANAGIKPFDQILAINDQKTRNWGSVVMVLALKYGDVNEITITVLPANQTKPLAHRLDVREWSIDKLHPNLIKSLGIVEYRPKIPGSELNYLKFSPLESIWQAARQVWLYLFFNFVIIWKMIMGVISLQSLSGPIGLLSGLVTALKQGLLAYTFFLGLLSINLAVINLLPIPGLDGSHLFYILFESVFKKTVSVRFQLLAFRLGAILIIILMIQAFLNDVMRFLE